MLVLLSLVHIFTWRQPVATRRCVRFMWHRVAWWYFCVAERNFENIPQHLCIPENGAVYPKFDTTTKPLSACLLLQLSGLFLHSVKYKLS